MKFAILNFCKEYMYVWSMVACSLDLVHRIYTDMMDNFYGCERIVFIFYFNSYAS